MLVGFTTHHGTVTAASDWDGPTERKRVRPAVAGSYEAMFHELGIARFLLTWRAGDGVAEGLLQIETSVARKSGSRTRPMCSAYSICRDDLRP